MYQAMKGSGSWFAFLLARFDAFEQFFDVANFLVGEFLTIGSNTRRRGETLPPEDAIDEIGDHAAEELRLTDTRRIALQAVDLLAA